MPATKVTISAEMVAAEYTITLEETENGAFTADATSATIGTTVNVTTTPAEGYQVNSLTITDAEGNMVAYAGEDSEYAFVMPGSDVTVAVSFEEIPEVTFVVSTSGTQNGQVGLSKTEAGAGSTVTINITPDAGYKVATVLVTDASGNVVEVTGSENVYTFVMPETEVDVAVTFEELPVEVVPQEEAPSNNNMLMWIIPLIVIVVAGVVVVLLVLKKKKQAA